MPMHYRITIVCAVLLALVGCWLSDDVFTRIAIAGGALGIAVVLGDLHINPHRAQDAEQGISVMSYYTSQEGSRVFPLLTYLAQHPEETLSSEQVAALMGCEVKQVRSLCLGLVSRKLVTMPMLGDRLHVVLMPGVQIDAMRGKVTAWAPDVGDEGEPMPLIQRRISAADAPPMVVTAPRSVFELGGRAHG